MDSEYSALMAELGQGPPPSSQTPQQQPPPRPFRPAGPSPSHFSGPPPALVSCETYCIVVYIVICMLKSGNCLEGVFSSVSYMIISKTPIMIRPEKCKFEQ